jgi:phage-related protein
MTKEEMIDSLIQQISSMQNYAQVESLILDVSRIAAVHGFPVSQCFSKLEITIEELSPMNLTSTQWSCFRYALICLREKASLLRKYRRH